MALPGVLLLLSAFLLLGVLLRRGGRLSPAAAPRLNGWALNVTVPAGVVLALHRFPLDAGLLRPSAVMAASTVLLWGMGLLAARALRLAPRDRPVLAAAVAFGNTAFLGFPIVRALYGEAGLAEAVLVDQVGSEPLAFTLGVVAAAHGGSGLSWRAELGGLLRFVPLWALLLGLGWSGLGGPALPAPLARALALLALLTVPLVMTSMGLVLRLGTLRQLWPSALVVCLLRLVAAPALAWAGALLVRLPPLPARVLVLESAMPTMLFTLVLAARAGLDGERAAAYIAATLALSPLTLAAWAALLG